MDVLFGAVSVESRQRDRLVMRSNLMGSVYDDPGQGRLHAVYPMESKTVWSPSTSTSVVLPEGEDVEADSFEKDRYTWTIPE